MLDEEWKEKTKEEVLSQAENKKKKQKKKEKGESLLTQSEIDLVVSTMKTVLDRINEAKRLSSDTEALMVIREKSAWLDGYNQACRDFQMTADQMRTKSLTKFLKNRGVN